MKVEKSGKRSYRIQAENGLFLTDYKPTQDIVTYYGTQDEVVCPNNRVEDWREITPAEHEEFEARKEIALASMGEDNDTPTY